MELTLQRITKDKNYTLGELSIDGEKFCHTLGLAGVSRKRRK